MLKDPVAKIPSPNEPVLAAGARGPHVIRTRLRTAFRDPGRLVLGTTGLRGTGEAAPGARRGFEFQEREPLLALWEPAA